MVEYTNPKKSFLPETSNSTAYKNHFPTNWTWYLSSILLANKNGQKAMKRFTKQNLNLLKIAAQIILFAGVNFRRNNYEVNYTMIKWKAYPRAKIATLNINVSTTVLQNEAKFIERNRSMRIFPSQI